MDRGMDGNVQGSSGMKGMGTDRVDKRRFRVLCT